MVGTDITDMSGDVLQRVVEIGVLPVVRLDDLGQAVELTKALLEGGIPIVEFTLTNPSALDAVRDVRRQLPSAVRGVGTVLDATSARLAILAGAQFLVTPAVVSDVVDLGRRYAVPVFCGALSPTEIVTAWQLGASCIKVFPASAVGPSYLKALREPLPHIPIMPSGGVTTDNAGSFIRAGAVAVSAGSQLVDRAAVEGGNWTEITNRARAFLHAVRDARNSAEG